MGYSPTPARLVCFGRDMAEAARRRNLHRYVQPSVVAVVREAGQGTAVLLIEEGDRTG